MFRGSFYPVNSLARLDSSGLQLQSSCIKLQGLHKEVLHMLLNGFHHLIRHVAEQYLHLLQRAGNHGMKHLPQSQGVINAPCIRNYLVANLCNPGSLSARLGNHQHAKSHRSQMNRGDISGVVIALFLQKSQVLLGSEYRTDTALLCPVPGRTFSRLVLAQPIFHRAFLHP